VRRLGRVLLGLLLVALFVFCIYGFLATFEPLPASVPWLWRCLYAALAAAAAFGLVRVCRRW
jgi:hypothetical protein